MSGKSMPRACTLCALLLLSVIRAEAAPERDAYVGVSAGAVAITPDGFNELDTAKDNEARVSAGLFAGLRLGTLPIASGLPVYAELGYQDIGRHTVSYKVNKATSDLTARGHSAYAAAKVHLWNPGRFSLYAKLGASKNSVSASTPPGQTAIPISGSSTGLLWGLGAQYDFDSRVSLRVEFTDFGTSSPKSSAGGVTAGVAFRF